MSFLASLLTGIAEFAVDVLMWKRHSDKVRHSEDLTKHTFNVAYFNFFTTVWIGLLSVGLMFLLIFGLNIPIGWGVGLGVTVGAGLGYWKYQQAIREED